MKRIFTLFFCATTFSYAHSQVVISQIYGGGGNAGSTYKNDFIELHNIGSTSINITGYAVQYASSAGTSWAVTALTTGSATFTLLPGQFYLVQEAAGNAGTTNLPTPDAIGTISMAAAAGKVALTTTTTVIPSISCPGASNNVIDLVTYAGNCPNPAPGLTATTADIRLANVNTGNNTADFSSGSPNPNNSSTIILPLQLLSFSASPKESTVAFSWKTANERNTHHFELEQSLDGTAFKSMATVAAAGNTTTEKSYSYSGNLNVTTTYYRLKMVDADGKSTTSPVVKVAPSKTGFSLGNVYPIPAKNNVTVEWNSNRAGATTLVLTDMSGRTVRTLNLQSTQGYNQYQLDINTLTSGQYVLRLKNDVNQMQTIITKQ